MTDIFESKLAPLCLAVAASVLLLAGTAHANTVRLLTSGHYGAKVDATTGANVCTVASGHVCRSGEQSTLAGGFAYPSGVTSIPGGGVLSGNVYIADGVNHRVQELTASGVFVSMFGWEVNETKDKQPTATQAEKNVCAAGSGDVCKAGVAGAAPGQFGYVDSVVADAAGNLYVAELDLTGSSTVGRRVQKLTPEGSFVWEIGNEVNATTNGNLCTEEEIVKAGASCVGPTAGGSGNGAFDFEADDGSLLAIGGTEERLYVGDQGKVQEFEAEGQWKHNLPLGANAVRALAVDSGGDAYVAYGESGTVHEFNANDEQVLEYGAKPREPHASLDISALALGQSGRLAVAESEVPVGGGVTQNGFISLYQAETGVLISETSLPESGYPPSGMSFSGDGERVYTAEPVGQEIDLYSVVPVTETVTGPGAVMCAPGPEYETAATMACGLTGEVNPQNVAKTTFWFQYGTEETFAFSTSPLAIATANVFSPVLTVVDLRPDQLYDYRLAAEDENTYGVPAHSAPVTFTTPSVPPRVACQQEAYYVTFSTATLSCSVNPENAKTIYRFQYGSCESLDSCSSVLETLPLESSAYGDVGVLQSATGLAPATIYRYRLVAENEHNQSAVGQEGSFTTIAAPGPTASTAAPTGVGVSSATLTGSVNPAGATAAYAFQVGVYNGASTVYSPVVTGPTGAGDGPVAESFTLNGLQPGTTYAYRIAISSAYTPNGEPVTGEPVLFTTAGLPTVLVAPIALNLLPIPAIEFPAQPAKASPGPGTGGRAQKLARALKACRAKYAKRAKRDRRLCERRARQKINHRVIRKRATGGSLVLEAFSRSPLNPTTKYRRKSRVQNY